MNRSSFVGVAAFCLGVCVAAQGQSDPLDGELKRLQGHWRVTEMVDNGHVLSDVEMQRGLPGGGSLDVIDNTILFKSPVDGTKSTKSFRLNPTTYPKQIAVMERDQVTGVGIYQLDKGKWVVCVANPTVPAPTEFSAPEKSGRTMLVMEPDSPGENGGSKLRLPPPPRSVPQVANPSGIPPAPIPNQGVAGRVLTDADVTRMLVGNWQLNDGEGLLDVSVHADGTCRSFRHTQTMSNFHTVFVPTPVSTGTWRVNAGQWMIAITSSWRADRINTQATFAVRSISTTDLILVDSLGRVIRAVRRP